MKGFTLIETLVAIAVLMLIITGPLTLALKSISAAVVSQNQITAFYLGQEAVEYIKNVRDNNFLADRNWLDGLAPCWNTNGCYADVPNGDLESCSANCLKIKYDAASGLYYNYQSGQDTIFTRVIKIDKNIPKNSDEAKIEVTISWTEKFGGQKSLTLQDEVFDWR